MHSAANLLKLLRFKKWQKEVGIFSIRKHTKCTFSTTVKEVQMTVNITVLNFNYSTKHVVKVYKFLLTLQRFDARKNPLRGIPNQITGLLEITAHGNTHTDTLLLQGWHFAMRCSGIKVQHNSRLLT